MNKILALANKLNTASESDILWAVRGYSLLMLLALAGGAFLLATGHLILGSLLLFSIASERLGFHFLLELAVRGFNSVKTFLPLLGGMLK